MKHLELENIKELKVTGGDHSTTRENSNTFTCYFKTNKHIECVKITVSNMEFRFIKAKPVVL